ncbi:class I SAM-dependent methyltransferase [Mesorhizobium sp. M0701]|uniref:class I SAM-dependent methyltransferase n=1 Tax=Mesorhizobium sp. M0701 TaxID=2956989 RepID=UPI003338B5A6
MVTNSSIRALTARRKIVEASRQFAALVRARHPFKKRDFGAIHSDLALYGDLARRYCGKDLAECSVVEIGFGSRPYRLYAMHAIGAKVTGVDLDHPLLSFKDIPAIYKANGFERMIKSLARYVLFDSLENRKIYRFFRQLSGLKFKPPFSALVVADAASPVYWAAHPGPYNLITSEDVFEHIPREGLAAVIRHSAAALAPGGIMITSPMIFTGLRGGHIAELYGYYGKGPIPAGVPPWDHLRGRTLIANTYLNELRRSDYRSMFSEHFDILEEVALNPDCGRHLLDEDLRAELADYSDDELFSNKVRFVLRRRSEA